MSNGLSKHDSGQYSRGGKKPSAAPLDDGADEETFIDEDSIAPDQMLDDDSEAGKKSSITDELEAAAAAETAIAKRRQHALRRIEACWEEKRLNELLREVYDEE